jgi:hypothetical protein
VSRAGEEDEDVMERIYRRIADVIKVPEGRLHPHLHAKGSPGTTNGAAESLEVRHYQSGEQQFPQHEWLANQPDSLFATVVIYLDDLQAMQTRFPNAKEGGEAGADYLGGQDSFPHASKGVGYTSRGEQGSALLLYHSLPDGNLDEDAAHATLRVEQGDRWTASLYVWDSVVAGKMRKLSLITHSERHGQASGQQKAGH